MNETPPPRRIFRSIGALLAGFVVVVVLSTATDAVMYGTSIFTERAGEPMSDLLFALATAYRALYAIAGSYLTARLAPYQPMKHALVGGFVGLVISAAGAIATWDKGPAFGPHWYPLALVATTMPCAWLGGRLRERQIAMR